MFGSTKLVGVALVGLALVVGSGSSQEKKAKTPLPAGFKALNLTSTQEDKIREVTADYKAKLDDLTKKVKELAAERLRAQLAVLTEEQRQLYIKNKTGEETKKKEAKKDAKKQE